MGVNWEHWKIAGKDNMAEPIHYVVSNGIPKVANTYQYLTNRETENVSWGFMASSHK